MSNLFGRLAIGAGLFLTAVVALAQPAAAAAFNVYVGYSDGLRGPGFFPSPWQGDAGVTFLGNSPGGSFDAGAIMIQNTSGASMTVDSVAVSINGVGVSVPWALPVAIANGNFLILTQTTDFNFDTSDIQGVAGAGPGTPATTCAITCPTVTIGVNGGLPQLFSDTAHTLDTLGFDFASVGNESFNWRLIGTCSGPGCGSAINPTPIPGALPLFVSGLGVFGFIAHRRKRKAQVV